MEYIYPTILRRYLATFIDGSIIFISIIAVSYIFQDNSNIVPWLRIGMVLAMLFIYEPLCTSKLCTIGQKITGVRVRKHFLHDRISIPSAYIRIFIKMILDLLSFFTILFSNEKRAIHDFAVDSIVIYSKPRFISSDTEKVTSKTKLSNGSLNPFQRIMRWIGVSFGIFLILVSFLSFDSNWGKESEDSLLSLFAFGYLFIFGSLQLIPFRLLKTRSKFMLYFVPLFLLCLSALIIGFDFLRDCFTASDLDVSMITNCLLGVLFIIIPISNLYICYNYYKKNGNKKIT